MTFGISFVQAQNEQSVNLRKLVDQIAQAETENNIFTFAKSTLEDEASEPWPSVQLHLGSSGYFPESDNTIDMVGTYLYKTTDEELRKRIQKDWITEREVLLQDFFNSITYQELRKHLEHVVYEMTSCNFLTPEESKILRESKGFYPNDYEKPAFKWNILGEKNKIRALEGQIHSVIGLKRNKDRVNPDICIATIDVNYQCSLNQVIPAMKLDETMKPFPETNIEPRYIEPQHTMAVTLTFLRNKNGNCNSVSFIFQASGGARIFSVPNTPTEGQNNSNSSPEYDFQKSFISEQWNIAHWCEYGCWTSDPFNYLVSQVSDFIIKTENPA